MEQEPNDLERDLARKYCSRTRTWRPSTESSIEEQMAYEVVLRNRNKSLQIEMPTHQTQKHNLESKPRLERKIDKPNLKNLMSDLDIAGCYIGIGILTSLGFVCKKVEKASINYLRKTDPELAYKLERSNGRAP